MKKLLFYYNRSIKKIKQRYFYTYYYKVVKLKLERQKKKRFKSSKNKKKQNLFNKSFHLPLRTIFQGDNSLNKSLVDKSKYFPLFNNINKNESFNINHEYHYSKGEKIQNNNRKNKNISNNKCLKNTLEYKKFQNGFDTSLNNKNNDIIFNYINDMSKCNTIYMNQRRIQQKKKLNILSGNKTLTNKEISKHKLNNNNNYFDFNEKEVFNYGFKNRNIKNEEEKNNRDIRTININNYYILNSSYFNENLKKEKFHNFYVKEYNSSFLKNKFFKIKSPKKKIVSHLKQIKSKFLDISKHIRSDSVNKINLKSNKYNNKNINIIYKSVQNKLPRSSKNTLEHNDFIKLNNTKNMKPTLKLRKYNKIHMNKNPILNLLKKVNINKNKEIKPNNFIKLFNTPNDLDNYNNSLLTTYYKDKNYEKETDDSGFYTISKNTSNRKYLINKLNINSNESKYTIPCSNDKNLNNLINNNNNLVLNIKNKYYTSNKKIPNAPKAKEKNSSYFRMINNKKEKINNQNLILQNLSFSNCSEHKNISDNKTKSKIIVDKKTKQVDQNKFINQKLDYIFIKNEKDNNINNINNYEDNKSTLLEKEKIIETSSETLNDSKIYEMAKLFIKDDEDYFDKHAMEEILKNKRNKNQLLNK